MLKLIHMPNPHPGGYPVDPTAEFEGGMIGQLKALGNDIVLGVSDGTAPLGIIDDIRTSSPTKAQVDEIVEVAVSEVTVDGNGQRVSVNEEVGFLDHPNIVDSSFISTVSVVLNSVNGAVLVPAGTVLNYDADEDGINDSFRIVVNYMYRESTMPGDDSTVSSGMITIYYQRGTYATDQFDTTQAYPMNATLYVGLDGRLTTKQATDSHPGVAMVTGPPGATNGTLEFLWF